MRYFSVWALLTALAVCSWGSTPAAPLSVACVLNSHVTPAIDKPMAKDPRPNPPTPAPTRHHDCTVTFTDQTSDDLLTVTLADGATLPYRVTGLNVAFQLDDDKAAAVSVTLNGKTIKVPRYR